MAGGQPVHGSPWTVRIRTVRIRTVQILIVHVLTIRIQTAHVCITRSSWWAQDA